MVNQVKKMAIECLDKWTYEHAFCAAYGFSSFFLFSG